MPRPPRLALVVVGLAVAVYGVASLTGGLLGYPLWSERWRPYDIEADRFYAMDLTADDPEPRIGRIRERNGVAMICLEREGWESASVGVVAVGLALAAVGAWPRRRPEPRPLGAA